jgi:hypothetical protein
VAEEHFGGVAQVVGGLLVDAALVARLRPAALVVAAVDVVVHGPHRPQAVRRAAEHAPLLAVHEDHAPRLAPRDRHAVAHASRQLERLEQPSRLRREDGDGPGAVGLQVALQVFPRAFQVRLQGGLVAV